MTYKEIAIRASYVGHNLTDRFPATEAERSAAQTLVDCLNDPAFVQLVTPHLQILYRAMHGTTSEQEALKDMQKYLAGAQNISILHYPHLQKFFFDLSRAASERADRR